MRRWTLFVAVLTILTMLLPAQFGQAKSESTDTKSSEQVHASSKSSSSKSTVTSAGDSKKRGKKHASSRETAKKSASAETVKIKSKGKKHAAAQATVKSAAPALPESYKGEFGVDTKAAMVLDMENGQVLFAQDADTPIAPASLTKIITLFLINEMLQNGSLKPDQIIPVSSEASHAGGSTMHLRTGELVPLDELIKGIAVASANDGCMAFAQFNGNGDFHPFVELMNRKAQELGMTNTHFFNPNGLPADGQVTTARDMALLARAYLTRFPQMLAIHSMTEFTHNNRVRHNSNSLLGKVEGVDGLKTGFVCSSGFNIVVTAKRNGTRLVVVVLGAKNHRIREREATRLVEEGFKIVAAENVQASKHVAMIR
jgi:D-alanyl-D-alanine carboxypeptidase (penicillin-binding protein 5/6)